MNSTIAQIFELNDECVAICHRLTACLHEERVALIELNTENIHQTNLRKEGLLTLLTEKKSLLRQVVSRAYRIDSAAQIADQLQGEDLNQWRTRYAEWQLAWRDMHELCVRNQKFLKHSIRNLGRIMDNLRRLCGETSLYSAKGTRVDAPLAGRVMETRV